MTPTSTAIGVTTRAKRARVGGRLRPGEAGFSLVEVMAAMMLMGLGAALIILTLPQGDDELAAAAKGFAATAERASQQAVISGAAFGFRITPDGYSVVRRRRGAWTPIGAEGLAGISWPDDIGVLLEEPAPPKTDRRSTFDRLTLSRRVAESAGPPPQIQFDATGAMTPFRVAFTGRDGEYVVFGQPNGAVRVETRDGF